MDIQLIKQRFGIIGNSPMLNRAIDTACQVAATDITVLVTGESGVGKEIFPKIIHQLSKRKHGQYIAVNCGAIPEGTIESELFGHEKGSFTGASEARKGYFEVADGGTIFLDEVAELPLSTQVRLLRVLETGEFIKVGSSKVLKTDARIVAATNENIGNAIAKGKFRQDLFYRLNTVPIHVPSLRERPNDIVLLFRKFASDSAEKYKMPQLELTENAKKMLVDYPWYGNIRQLKNITEQISIIEPNRTITDEILKQYLPNENKQLPVLYENKNKTSPDFSEREILYKVLFDMRNDINELKKLVVGIIEHNGLPNEIHNNSYPILDKLYENHEIQHNELKQIKDQAYDNKDESYEIEHTAEIIEDTLSLQKIEKDIIKKAIEQFPTNRKMAATELGISERTLYRKLKEYNLN